MAFPADREAKPWIPSEAGKGGGIHGKKAHPSGSATGHDFKNMGLVQLSFLYHLPFEL